VGTVVDEGVTNDTLGSVDGEVEVKEVVAGLVVGGTVVSDGVAAKAAPNVVTAISKIKKAVF